MKFIKTCEVTYLKQRTEWNQIVIHTAK